MDSQPWMEIAVFDMQLGESKMWNPGYTVSYLYIYWKKSTISESAQFKPMVLNCMAFGYIS